MSDSTIVKRKKHQRTNNDLYNTIEEIRLKRGINSGDSEE